VWLGRYSGAGAGPTQYNHLELYVSAPPAVPEPPEPNVHRVACSVGYVAFIYWGTRSPRTGQP
jgi:hypothetical protein